MTPNWDFPKNRYLKLWWFEVQVSFFKNCESSVLLSEVIPYIFKKENIRILEILTGFNEKF
jgi:hypothetical protein